MSRTPKVVGSPWRDLPTDAHLIDSPKSLFSWGDIVEKDAFDDFAFQAISVSFRSSCVNEKYRHSTSLTSRVMQDPSFALQRNAFRVHPAVGLSRPPNPTSPRHMRNFRDWYRCRMEIAADISFCCSKSSFANQSRLLLVSGEITDIDGDGRG